MQLLPVDRSIAVTAKAEGPVASPSAGTPAATDPTRAGVTPSAGAKGDYLDARPGGRGPDTPSSTADTPNRDWTTTEKAAAEARAKAEEEVKPRLFEMLIEQFNSLWRASAQAVDATTQTQALTQATRQSQQDTVGKDTPLVYTDPSKVRKTSSAGSA
ncbi:hypothetical protein GN316_11865 [Xylophilus sp. Kf1]|nr:hypothetical protein [Xylophilus sp. Kf1]